MQKWDYLAIGRVRLVRETTETFINDAGHITQALKTWGAEGWEHYGTWDDVFYFKRPIQTTQVSARRVAA